MRLKSYTQNADFLTNISLEYVEMSPAYMYKLMVLQKLGGWCSKVS